MGRTHSLIKSVPVRRRNLRDNFELAVSLILFPQSCPLPNVTRGARDRKPQNPFPVYSQDGRWVSRAEILSGSTEQNLLPFTLQCDSCWREERSGPLQ